MATRIQIESDDYDELARLINLAGIHKKMATEDTGAEPDSGQFSPISGPDKPRAMKPEEHSDDIEFNPPMFPIDKDLTEGSYDPDYEGSGADFYHFGHGESYVSPEEKRWLNWVKDAEKKLGHSLDGDEETDGYSLDGAYAAFEQGVTADQYAAEIGGSKDTSLEESEYDPSMVKTDQLLRTYKFHLNDRGTQTMEEEVRRMHLLQEIGSELQNRGVKLPSESADRDEGELPLESDYTVDDLDEDDPMAHQDEEVRDCPACFGQKPDCMVCDGTNRTVECHECHGQHNRHCTNCGGYGYVTAPDSVHEGFDDFDDEDQEPCPDCDGDDDCRTCQGTGWIDSVKESDTWVGQPAMGPMNQRPGNPEDSMEMEFGDTCEACNGTKKIVHGESGREIPCPYCQDDLDNTGFEMNVSSEDPGVELDEEFEDTSSDVEMILGLDEADFEPISRLLFGKVVDQDGLDADDVDAAIQDLDVDELESLHGLLSAEGNDNVDAHTGFDQDVDVDDLELVDEDQMNYDFGHRTLGGTGIKDGDNVNQAHVYKDPKLSQRFTSARFSSNPFEPEGEEADVNEDYRRLSGLKVITTPSLFKPMKLDEATYLKVGQIASLSKTDERNLYSIFQKVKAGKLSQISESEKAVLAAAFVNLLETDVSRLEKVHDLYNQIRGSKLKEEYRKFVKESSQKWAVTFGPPTGSDEMVVGVTVEADNEPDARDKATDELLKRKPTADRDGWQLRSCRRIG